jgi:hypothetical protein
MAIFSYESVDITATHERDCGTKEATDCNTLSLRSSPPEDALAIMRDVPRNRQPTAA